MIETILHRWTGVDFFYNCRIKLTKEVNKFKFVPSTVDCENDIYG